MKKKNALLKLSASAIKTYEQCPRKFYFTYIERRPKKSWPHLDLGNFVHEVLEKFHIKAQKQPRESWPRIMSSVAQAVRGSFTLTQEHAERAQEMLGTYLAILGETGMPPVLSNEQSFKIVWEDENILLRGFIDRIDKEGDNYHIVDYKGLAVDTPIPTPSGWALMKDLKVGDWVLGSDGKPTKVTAKSQTHHRPCYRIIFSNKEEIVADNVHKWKVGLRGTGVENYDEVVSTEDLFKRFNQLSEGSFVIENSAPIELEDNGLPTMRADIRESYLTHAAQCRKIVNIEQIPTVPTECISVDASDSLYLCGKSFIPTHNTGKSKYLDEFQLLVYGLYLLSEHEDLEKFRGSYLVLGENCKEVSYTFTKTDLDRCAAKIKKVAAEIRSEKTWEPKPQFLCGYCDFEEICPATKAKREESWSQKSSFAENGA